MLIDLNEEIFAVSECLAQAFSTNAPTSQQMLQQANMFEQRKL